MTREYAEEHPDTTEREKLAAYRHARERDEAAAALAKPASERSAQEERQIAYSRHGTASGCGG